MEHVPPSSIRIERDERQRREINLSDEFLASIKRGILNPLIIDQDNVLIAGERRLTAALKLNLPEVPVRRFRDLSQEERLLIELEENIQREDLPWQDKCRAMRRMYNLYQQVHPGAPQWAFAESIGYSRPQVTTILDAAAALERDEPAVKNAPTLTKAVNVITRQRERANQNTIADIVDAIGAPDTGTAEAPTHQGPREASEDILLADFTLWAPAYKGPKFNLLHCDFPYGIDLDASDQVQAQHEDRLKTYKDSEELYWRLLETLANNAERLLSTSAHVIFWFSLKHFRATQDFFSRRLPFIEFDEFPLIWLKSDNKGIAPDVERRPRRIYETALFGAVGDRKLVKMVSNGYPAPKANSHHMSEKPEPVLRHFFQLAVDGNTRLLDPTCGSGSSLRAAESLGAGRVLGLELEPTFHAQAVKDLKQSRNLKFLAEKAA